MVKKILILLIVMAIPLFGNVDEIDSYTGDLVFQGTGVATQMSQFCSTYGSGNGTLDLIGSLTVKSSDATNLTGLSCLKSISKFVLISGNTSLTSLSGLNSVRTIGDYLNITGNSNSNFTSISGLNSLTSIGNYFWLTDNPYITSLKRCGSSNCANITDILNEIIVSDTLNMTSLFGIQELTYGSLEITDNQKLATLEYVSIPSTKKFDTVSISNNPVLTSISNLYGLESVDDIFMIYNNPKLISLTGLEKLTKVGNGSGRLVIQDNEAIKDFTGLSLLSNVDGEFFVENNDSLVNFQGFANSPNVTSISVAGYFLIQDNQSLYSMKGLEKIKFIELLSISGNSSLEYIGEDNISGFKTLSQVVDYIDISENPKLKQIDANSFPMLNNLGDGVSITSNPSLISISSAFDAVSTTSGQFSVEIYQNDILNTLNGFNGLTSISQLINISNNLKLTNISGFKNLNFITNNFLSIFNNPELTSIDAFDNLKSIDKYFVISDCPKFQNINNSFKNLQTVGEDFKIENTNLDFLTNFYSVESVGKNGTLNQRNIGIWIRNNPRISQSEFDALITEIGSSNIKGPKVYR